MPLNPIGLALLVVLALLTVVGMYNYSKQQYGPALLTGIAMAILCVVIIVLQIPL